MPRPKILIVDDSDDVRDPIARLLKLADYEVFEAEGGADGIRYAEALKPDLILLDLLMPDINGTEVLRQIGSRGIATRVIMLTAVFGSLRNVIDHIQLGACDYILQPVDNDQLLNSIERALTLETTTNRTPAPLIQRLAEAAERLETRLCDLESEQEGLSQRLSSQVERSAEERMAARKLELENLRLGDELRQLSELVRGTAATNKAQPAEEEQSDISPERPDIREENHDNTAQTQLTDQAANPVMRPKESPETKEGPIDTESQVVKERMGVEIHEERPTASSVAPRTRARRRHPGPWFRMIAILMVIISAVALYDMEMIGIGHIIFMMPLALFIILMMSTGKRAAPDR